MTPLTKGRTTVKASINPPLAIRGRATVTLSTNQPSALAGGASLTVNGGGSSEPHPLSPAGAARKKIKWTENRLLICLSVICLLIMDRKQAAAVSVHYLSFNFLQAAPAGISWRGSLEPTS